MSIAVGTRISRYEILSKLGVGGMGEVYKAHDTSLDRNVALKILPPDLVQDPDRVRRFVQEAKSASALSHPHIITIYEIGEVKVDPGQVMESKDSGAKTSEYSAPAVTSDIHFIAMELVDGETLNAKIYREKVELKKLLEYLIQTADGLAKAHASGIVHRDLKPDNIMVTHDEYAKILDFGLAKLVEQQKPDTSADDITEADTAIMQRTQAGVVMGTVGYMSPEQVQGKTVDSRSDIFSFGCVLYEAATRHKPFEGESMIDTLHKIVYTPPPPPTEFNPDVPDELQRIVRKCLAKDPDERYQSMKDVAVDLRQLKREYDSGAVTTGAHHAVAHDTGAHAGLPTGFMSGPVVSTPPEQKSLKWRLYAPIGLVVLAAIVFGIYKLGFGRRSGPYFLNIKLSRLTNNGKTTDVAISPDGKYVVYVLTDAGKQSLWVRQVATSSNVPLIPAAQVGMGDITFSPDGNYVYYISTVKGSVLPALFQIPVLGGTPRKLVSDLSTAITLSPDGKQMAFIRPALGQTEYHLVVANIDGTGEKVLSKRKLPEMYQSAAWSPDGSFIACYAGSVANGSSFGIVGVSLKDGKETTIVERKWVLPTTISWVSDGSGIILSIFDRPSSSSQLWFVPYPKGEPRQLTNDLNSYSGVSITADSRAMVTVQQNQVSNLWVVPDLSANQPKQLLTAGPYTAFSWTPDGKIIYVSTDGGKPDIWQMDADGGNRRQLSNDVRSNLFPTVSLDGRYIVYCALRTGIQGNMFDVWRMDRDGGNPKQLTSGELGLFPQIAPDGKTVVYVSTASGKPTIWKTTIDGDKPVQLTPNVSQYPAISPDGKFVACVYVDEKVSQRATIAILPIEGGEPIKTVKKITVGRVQWTPDGKSLAYIDSHDGIHNMFTIPIDGGEPKQLTQFNSDYIFWFAFSNDFKQLLSTRGTVATDVVLINDANPK